MHEADSRSVSYRARCMMLLLFSLACTVAWGAEPDASAVIAESSRARVTLADYEAELAKIPGQARADFGADSVRLRQYLDNMYMLRVLAADARAGGLDKDPVLARQIAQQVDLMLARARVDRIEAQAAADFDRNVDRYTARARELYDTDPAKYKTPELVRAAHILIKVVNGDSKAAEQKAEQIRAQAVAGADFGKLARQYSDDHATAEKGGGLGFFERKMMDPAFAKAAFALTKAGDISPPVLSKFGYHVIRLEDRKPAGVRSFEEVKPELLAQLKSKALEDARAAEQRAIFSDPTLKVNAALIEQLHTEAAARAASAVAGATAPPPKSGQ
jgi:peptidyl-prolyl cis-trans isomerase C